MIFKILLFVKRKCLFNETDCTQTIPEHYTPYLMAVLQIVSKLPLRKMINNNNKIKKK